MADEKKKISGGTDMYMKTETYKSYVATNDGSELEFREEAISLRAVSCREVDGVGRLKLDHELNPIPTRALHLLKMTPVFRLRHNGVYMLCSNVRFVKPLPTGIRGVVCLSADTIGAGLLSDLVVCDGMDNNLIKVTCYPKRQVEIDGMFPFASLRFEKVDAVIPQRKRT